jgi:hypothetical protein
MLSKLQVFDRFYPYFDPRGYQSFPDLSQYRKNESFGFKTMILSITNYPEETMMEAHLGVRLQEVEEMAYQFTQGLPGFRKDSMTMVTSMARLSGKPHWRFHLQNEDDLNQAYLTVIDFMETKGIDLLNQWSNKAHLNFLYNGQPDNLQLHYNLFNKAVRGLVIARQAGGSNFEQLIKAYEQLLKEKYIPEQQMKAFYRLIEFLMVYHVN